MKNEQIGQKNKNRKLTSEELYNSFSCSERGMFLENEGEYNEETMWPKIETWEVKSNSGPKKKESNGLWSISIRDIECFWD